MSSEDLMPVANKEYASDNDKVFLLNIDSSEDNVRLKGGFFQRRQNRLRLPKMAKIRTGLQKMNCFKPEEEEIVMMEMPRHKSIDIGVGFARRMSLFLFTRRSVCVHPYHPFTPKQSTRKIYMHHDDHH